MRYPKKCSGDDCVFLIQWLPFNDFVEITMYAKITKVPANSVWFAIGFSKDKLMVF